MARRSYFEADRELVRATRETKVPAIARAAAVLRLLARSGKPLGVQQISRELGIVPSACLYTLRALMNEDFVAFDTDTKRYSLDIGILALGRNWLTRNRIGELLQPVLDRLAADMDVSVFGTHVRGLEHIIVLAVSQTSSSFTLTATIGSRFAALTSATGRCVAAFGDHDEADLRTHFKDVAWTVPLSFDDWMNEVQETRLRGYAIDDGRHKPGTTFIAAPVFDGASKLTNCICLTGISSVLRSEGFDKIGQAVAREARSLTDRLDTGH